MPKGDFADPFALPSVWTENPHLEPELRRLAGKGVSAMGIARSLKHGLTRNAVIGKAARLKLTLAGSQPSRKRPVDKDLTETERQCQEPSPPRRFSWEAEHVS